MQNSENKTLESKLEEYFILSKSISLQPSAVAKTVLPLGASLFGALSSLEAQIVYSGVQNVTVNIPINFNQVAININGAGGNDFEIQNNVVGGVAFIQVNEAVGGDFAINGFIGTLAGAYAYPYANALDFVIGAAGPWANGVGDANTLAVSGVNAGNYPRPKWTALANGTTRFIGFRGTIGGNTKYGWIRLTKNSHTNYTIVDWAYNNTSNTSIKAGQTVDANSADIAVTKSVSPSPTSRGTTVTYTITVINNGPNAATGVEITDIVPAGLTFVAGSMTGPGTYVSASPSGTGLKWQGLSIANGSSVTLTFQATVN